MNLIHADCLDAMADGTPSIIGDCVEAVVQRVDAQRVLQLALQSQGVNIPDSQVPSLLRDIEEGGYTLRLTTSEERAFRNRHGGSE